MHRFQPYVDLRQNTGKAEVKDSLWPAFTDIMAVVLMIFMLSMVVIIIRNTDLARQLKTVEEQLQTNRLAQSDLQSQIAEIEEDLRKKEMEIILLGDENQFVKSTLEGKLAIISALESDLSNLKEKAGGLEEAVASREQQLVQMQSEKESEIAGLKKQHEDELVALTEEMEKKIDEFNRKFSALAQVITERDNTILILNRKEKELALTLAKQRRDYTVLEEKYNELFRPARSPSGKTVVTVHYSRRGNEYPILFKDFNSKTYEEIEERQLHKRLSDLKKQYKNDLYVKIIIPEDSNLSYNEAWSFTRDILSRYDYFYQEDQEK